MAFTSYLAAPAGFAPAKFESGVPPSVLLGLERSQALAPVDKGEPGVRGLAEITAAMNCSLPDTWERLEFTAN